MLAILAPRRERGVQMERRPTPLLKREHRSFVLLRRWLNRLFCPVMILRHGTQNQLAINRHRIHLHIDALLILMRPSESSLAPIGFAPFPAGQAEQPNKNGLFKAGLSWVWFVFFLLNLLCKFIDEIRT